MKTKIILILIVLFFVFIEIAFISFPLNLHFVFGPDEARLACYARSIGANNTSPDAGYCFEFLNRIFPIVSERSHGALELYLTFPFLAWNDTSVIALRAATIFWGILIVILTYYFTSLLFNKKVGILASWLLVLSPSFITLVRLGMRVGFTMPIFSLLSLILFWQWHKTRRNLFFNLAMFTLGFGFNAKGRFLWFIITLFIAGMIHWRYLKPKIKTILSGMPYLCIGFLPAIYFDFKYNHKLSGFIYHNLFVTKFNINNFQFMENLLYRLSHFKSIINRDMCVGEHLLFFRNFPLLFFVSIFIFLLYFSIYPGRKGIFPKQRITFILSIIISGIMLSCFSLTGFRETHLYFLFPFLQIMMSVGIYELVNLLKYRRITKALVCLFTGLFIIAEAVIISKSYRSCQDWLRINKGASIYELAAWLDNRIQSEELIWCDFHEPFHILFLIKRLRESKIKNYYMRDRAAEKFVSGNFSGIRNEIMADSSNIFVFLNDDYPSPEYKAFRSLADELGKQVVEEKTFVNQRGQTRFLICSLKKEKK